MKTLALLNLWLVVSACCEAGPAVAEFDWNRLPAPPGTTTSTVDSRTVLAVKSTNTSGLTLQLLKIPSPGITGNTYALIGEIKYEDVQGDGFLEMWNYFPPLKPGSPEGRFFSRTLGTSGEMAKIKGTSGWRRFSLPFDRTGSSSPPTRLELNLVLPGSGAVYLGPLQLIDHSSNSGGGASNAWWSDRSAGLIGGIGGAVLGCLGSLLAWMASTGRARSFVLGTLQSLIGLGVAVAIAGLVAVVLRQPYAVWFPLVLGAALLLGILPSRLRQYRRQFEATELRRMDSADARG